MFFVQPCLNIVIIRMIVIIWVDFLLVVPRSVQDCPTENPQRNDRCFIICWIAIHQLIFFGSTITKKTCVFCRNFCIVCWNHNLFSVIFDETENKCFPYGIRQDCFLQSSFSSPDNVDQQKKIPPYGPLS